VALLGLLLAVSASASARKAKSLYEQGRKAEVEKNYDRALELFQQALSEDPGHQRYDLAARRMQFMAAQAHVDRGQQLRDEGHLEEALSEFQRAMEIDPSLSVAQQEHKRTLEKLEKRRESPQEETEKEDASPLEQERRESFV
jgi:tetratricopeptide (TPR) repeat protein